ncbi:RNA N6-adenosine-methyltransferase mettl16 [Picochlorum sp. SENEW3]|nr:RNA N6-adenosine-methyltransferase mettl16 [Picochlorum sp. SENEW3]
MQKEGSRIEEQEGELKECLHELHAVLREDPLNEEVQQIRYRVYESLLEVTSSPSSPVLPGASKEDKKGGEISQQQRGETSIQKKKRKLDVQEREWCPKRRRMHPKNIYSIEKPDFVELSRLYPSLKPFLKTTAVNTSTAAAAAASSDEGCRRISIDFQDDDACRELVRVQLHHDFGIEWSLDPPYLVPPLANRLNYICWLDDVLSLWSRHRTERRCILDIGCGANLIYPLLGASYVGWRCIGCDVNADALRVAARNREANPDLAPLIHLRLVSMQPCQQQPDDGETKNPKGIISSCIRDGDGELDACMCNPPFFSREEEAGKNPKTAFGGVSMEMVYPGGEEAFIKNMIWDSAKHTTACTWFSSMVGKKSTMKMARKMIHDLGRTVVRTTEFVQGKTSRWALAWSFVAPQDVALKPLSRTIL